MINAKWCYEYPFDALFQHSVRLSERLVFSPFFVIERESGECMWEAPESSDRDVMLYPRALSDGVIVAEKYQNVAGKAQFAGIFRFDATTGAALDPPANSRGTTSAGASFAACVQGWLRGSHRGLVDLSAAKLQAVRNDEIFTAAGDVIDIHTGSRVGKTSADDNAVPNWTPLVKLDANADFVAIPGFGALYPGGPPQPNLPQGDDQFWNQWPHTFHLRQGADAVWSYDDRESQAANFTGSLTYDQILPPNLFFLLYKIRKDSNASTARDFIFDIALRRVDLQIGQIVDHVEVTNGPVHKWPSIADVDERGVVVMFRGADTKTTTFTYFVID